MGRQGKSSLAARIAHRKSQHAVVVLYGRYDAGSILEAFHRAARSSSRVREIFDRYGNTVRSKPAMLEPALRELLEGPFKENIPEHSTQRAALLVIDDFEQALEASNDGLHRVKPEFVEARRFCPEHLKVGRLIWELTRWTLTIRCVRCRMA